MDRKLPEESVQVRLTDGTVMVIDALDLEIVNEFRWFPSRTKNRVYAAAKQDGRTMYAHRLIARAYLMYDPATRKWKATDVVDHIDGDTLNNTRANLRIASRAQNQRNTVGRPRHRASRFKGVSLARGNTVRRWRATIEVDGMQLHLGYFATEEEAAGAYDSAAAMHFGEFARLNFGIGTADIRTSTITEQQPYLERTGD